MFTWNLHYDIIESIVCRRAVLCLSAANNVKFRGKRNRYEEKTKKKSLKVENGKDVQTVLSDASIKTIDGGYEEMNKEQSGREKSGR